MALSYDLDLIDDQIVLYADIIAFSKAVFFQEHTAENPNGIWINLRSFQESIFEHYSTDYLNAKNLNFIFVSDSIFITTNSENVNQLLTEVTYLTHAFYCMGFSIRGAISRGRVYNGINIWGPAVCQAVGYEDNAEFPCIVVPKHDISGLNISEDFLEFLKDAAPTEFYKLHAKYPQSFFFRKLQLQVEHMGRRLSGVQAA